MTNLENTKEKKERIKEGSKTNKQTKKKQRKKKQRKKNRKESKQQRNKKIGMKKRKIICPYRATAHWMLQRKGSSMN